MFRSAHPAGDHHAVGELCSILNSARRRSIHTLSMPLPHLRPEPETHHAPSNDTSALNMFSACALCDVVVALRTQRVLAIDMEKVISVLQAHGHGL